MSDAEDVGQSFLYYKCDKLIDPEDDLDENDRLFHEIAYNTDLIYDVIGVVTNGYPRYCLNDDRDVKEWNCKCSDYGFDEFFEKIDSKKEDEIPDTYIYKNNENNFEVCYNCKVLYNPENSFVLKPDSPVKFSNSQCFNHFIQKMNTDEVIRDIVSDEKGFYVPVAMRVEVWDSLDLERLKHHDLKQKPSKIHIGRNEVRGWFGNGVCFKVNLNTSRICLYSRDGYDELEAFKWFHREEDRYNAFSQRINRHLSLHHTLSDISE